MFANPDKFDPERFIDSYLISEKRSPFNFIPFLVGSRDCIGKFSKILSLNIILIFILDQRFAGLEERVVLSTLFRRLSFQSTKTIDELHLSLDVILRARVPIQMFIQ